MMALILLSSATGGCAAMLLFAPDAVIMDEAAALLDMGIFPCSSASEDELSTSTSLLEAWWLLEDLGPALLRLGSVTGALTSG